jgi:O-antigen ligase
MTWNRLPGRNSGWWDPVVGGSLLTAALGLHLPAAMWGRGAWSVLGFAGAGATVLGLIATGTRGAWIASAGLVAVALIVGAWRVRPRRLLVKPLLGISAMALLSALLAWAAFGEEIRERFDAGRREVVAAIERKEFRSDTGARLLMAWWAVEAIESHPVTGVGLGGFEAWSRAHVEAQGIDPATRRFHGHAHNALLHAGATLGVPGLLLAAAFALLAIRGAAVRQAGDGPPGYADGPCFALVGLLLVSAFDTIQVNSHTAALLGVLMVFAVERRPAPRTS